MDEKDLSPSQFHASVHAMIVDIGLITVGQASQCVEIAGILVFLVPGRAAVALLWSLCGFGLGLLTLGGQGYLMDRASARHLGVLTAFYYWGYTFGSTLSNTVTGLVLERVGYGGVGIGLLIVGATTMGVTILLLPGSPRKGAPGLRASAHDLASLVSGLGHSDLVGPQALERVLTPQDLPGGSPNPQNYALGWRLGQTQRFLGGEESYRVAHHGGVSSGSSAFVLLFPDQSFAVAVLTNSRTGSSPLADLAFEVAEPFMAKIVADEGGH